MVEVEVGVVVEVEVEVGVVVVVEVGIVVGVVVEVGLVVGVVVEGGLVVVVVVGVGMKPQGTRKRLTQAQQYTKRAKARVSSVGVQKRKRALTELLDAAFKPLR